MKEEEKDISKFRRQWANVFLNSKTQNPKNQNCVKGCCSFDLTH